MGEFLCVRCRRRYPYYFRPEETGTLRAWCPCGGLMVRADQPLMVVMRDA